MRAIAMPALGGRSPMEVVMGLKPQLPATLSQALPVEHKGVSDYVVSLLEDLMKGYKEILELGREAHVTHEGEDSGRLESLKPGEHVMVRKAGKAKPQGASRFESWVPAEVVMVDKVLGANTYSLKSLIDGEKSFLDGVVNRFHAERLVRVELPGLGLVEGPHQLEITTNGEDWENVKLVKAALDGRVLLDKELDPGRPVWTDLPRLRYRWIS